MNLSYKSVETVDRSDQRWKQLDLLAESISNRLNNLNTDPNILVDLAPDLTFHAICDHLISSMKQKNIENLMLTLRDFYVFSQNNPIDFSSEFNTHKLVLNLLFIIEDRNNIFQFNLRQMAIDVIFGFIQPSSKLSDLLVQHGIIINLTNIINDSNLYPLHLHILKCLRSFANHCEMCQDVVCENLPLEYLQSFFSKEGDYKDTQMEILNLLKNVVKYPICFELVEFCFDIFIVSLQIDIDFLPISLLGIYRITRQPREFWYPLFEDSILYTELPKYFLQPNFSILQSTFLLISALYKELQTVDKLHLSFDVIIDFLHYKDEINNDESSVRLYAAIALKEILRQDRNFVNQIIKSGFFEAFSDVYDSSSFSVKYELVSCLVAIATNGFESNKLELIKRKFIKFFFDRIELGDSEQICEAIDALDNLFRVNYMKLCYEQFKEAPNHSLIFDLPSNQNQAVASKSIEFLNTYFPKQNGQITILI